MIDERHLRRALSERVPHLSTLPIQRLDQSGTDNDIFRLGEVYCIRLPRHAGAAGQLEKEVTYLGRLQNLPLTIPKVIELGRPFPGHDHVWAIYNWLEGTDLHRSETIVSASIVETLGAFLRALWACDPANGPAAGPQNHYRGSNLLQRDELTRTAIHTLSDEFSTEILLAKWERACATEPHQGPSVWVHGDLHAANILAKDGVLVGIIDWGLMGIGDPAIDLMPAWSLMDQNARAIFREITDASDAIWQRGIGWSLSVACIAYAYYRDRENYWLNEISVHTLNALMESDAPPSPLDS